MRVQGPVGPAFRRVVRAALSLFHRMEADEVSLGVQDMSDETVFADGLFLVLDPSAVLDGTGGHFGAVCAGEVDDRSSDSRILSGHLDQRSCAARAFPFHGESPQLDLG